MHKNNKWCILTDILIDTDREKKIFQLLKGLFPTKNTVKTLRNPPPPQQSYLTR